jgi:hypothetical protein
MNPAPAKVILMASTELSRRLVEGRLLRFSRQKPLEITLRQAQDDFKLVASRNV